MTEQAYCTNRCSLHCTAKNFCVEELVQHYRSAHKLLNILSPSARKQTLGAIFVTVSNDLIALSDATLTGIP